MKKVTFPHMNALHILQVGAGGIGSAVVADLARLIHSVGELCTISYRIADGDRVEESNLLRQNFINPDLAKNKAMVLAERYSRAYGIPISYSDQYVTDKKTFDDLLFPPDGYDWHKGIIILGCVDDNGARKLMHEVYHVPEPELRSDYETILVSSSAGIDSTGTLRWALKNFPKGVGTTF